MSEDLTYKEKWQDPAFADLFPGFKELILPRHEHLYNFHIFGQDYGTSGADTHGTTLSGFRPL